MFKELIAKTEVKGNTLDAELTADGFKIEEYSSLEEYLIKRSAHYYDRYNNEKAEGKRFRSELWKRELTIASRYFGVPDEPEKMRVIADSIRKECGDLIPHALSSARYYSPKYRDFLSLGTYKAFRDQVIEYKEGLK